MEGTSVDSKRTRVLSSCPLFSFLLIRCYPELPITYWFISPADFIALISAFTFDTTEDSVAFVARVAWDAILDVGMLSRLYSFSAVPANVKCQPGVPRAMPPEAKLTFAKEFDNDSTPLMSPTPKARPLAYFWAYHAGALLAPLITLSHVPFA